MNLLTIDINGNQSCEAYDHPSECSEPAPGSVSQYQSETNSVTVTNANGDSSRLACEADANLKFPSHAHDHDAINGCHEKNDHTLIPDKTSTSVTINGSPVFVGDTSIATDPGSGGKIDAPSDDVNSSVVQS